MNEHEGGPGMGRAQTPTTPPRGRLVLLEEAGPGRRPSVLVTVEGRVVASLPAISAVYQVDASDQYGVLTVRVRTTHAEVMT